MSFREHSLKETAGYLKITEQEILALEAAGQIQTRQQGNVKLYSIDFNPKRDPKYVPIPPPPPKKDDK